jgi:hypothetical protein
MAALIMGATLMMRVQTRFILSARRRGLEARRYASVGAARRGCRSRGSGRRGMRDSSEQCR